MSRLMDEEDSLCMKADNQGDEEKALKHYFNYTALFWASQAIVLSPNMIQK